MQKHWQQHTKPTQNNMLIITETTLRQIIAEELDKETDQKIAAAYFNSSPQGLHFAEMMASEDLQRRIKQHYETVKRFITYAEANWPSGFGWYPGVAEYDDAEKIDDMSLRLGFRTGTRAMAKEFNKMFHLAWTQYENPNKMGNTQENWDALKQWAGL